MRILMLTAEYPPDPGGVGDYTSQLARALAARGHELAVLTGSGPEQRDNGLTVRRAVESWSWSLAGAVRQALAELRPELLHIQYQTGAYAMHPAINLLPRRLRGQGPPALVTLHDLRMPYLLPKAAPLRRWVTRRLVEDASAVIVTNEEDAQRLGGQGRHDPEQYLGRPATRLLRQIPIGSNIAQSPPAGYSRAAQRAALGAGDETLLVGYFGLLSRSKGGDLLLEALAGLPERFQLLLIGGEAQSPEDRRFAAELERQIERRGLGRRVRRTGQLDAEQVSAHLLACDLAALPFRDGASYRRGSLLASLAHGLPTVTTSPAYSLSPALDGHAMLIAPGDAAALASALAELAGSAALRERYAAAALRLAGEFDWAAIARHHEQVYQQVLRGE